MSYPSLADKDPDSIVDYAVDWSDWMATGDSISTSVWILPAGLTEESKSNTSTVATIFVSGGTAGTQVLVTNRITTAQARTEDRTFMLYITDK
jgi:hypothetical protein